jgi:hypothetical protein
LSKVDQAKDTVVELYAATLFANPHNSVTRVNSPNVWTFDWFLNLASIGQVFFSSIVARTPTLLEDEDRANPVNQQADL